LIPKDIRWRILLAEIMMKNQVAQNLRSPVGNVTKSATAPLIAIQNPE
jgi:hypothetical protein